MGRLKYNRAQFGEVHSGPIYGRGIKQFEPGELRTLRKIARTVAREMPSQRVVYPEVITQCPRCLRTGPKRRMFPDGSCQSVVACNKERALAIAEGLMEEEMTATQTKTDEVRKIPAATLIKMDPKEIVEKHGVHLTDAYKLRKQATAELNSAGADESLKGRVLKVIQTHGQQPDLLSVQEHLDGHPPMQDISRAIWALQKQGELTFYERKHGKDSVLTQIKLPKGHRSAGRSTGHAKPKAVGRDMTEARYQPSVAPGGPVERIPPRPAPIQQDIVPTPAYVAPVTPEVTPVRYAAAEPPRQNEKVAPPALKQNGYDVDRAVFLTKLEKSSPLIFALMELVEKRASYEKAAAALEGIDDEMALELLSKVSLLPFEEEVVNYVRSSRT